MKYQINYKLHLEDENEHSKILNADNQEKVKIKFKKYCDDIEINCNIIDIIEL